MSLDEQAAQLDHKGIVALLVAQQQLTQSVAEITARNAELTRQLEWFKRQLFDSKSERRPELSDVRQLWLGEWVQPKAAEPTVTVPEHQRRKSARSGDEETDDSKLRFDPSVPVEEIRIPTPKPEDGAYEVIGEKVTHRLAQRPGTYVVLKYVREVIKRRDDGTLSCAPAPPAVLERSVADVSLLAGLIIDKLKYHLPLYRQHQRMEAAGVHLARSTLTGYVHRVGDLLWPVYEEHLRSVLQSQVLAMDETPIKAGRSEQRKKMQVAYFWPVYGDRDEVVFPFSPTRAGSTVHEILGQYRGVLLSDGYQAYDGYASKVNGVVQALCWSHCRRQFLEAEAIEPELTVRALEAIRLLYEAEARLKKKGLEDARKIEERAVQCKPIVDAFFAWLSKTIQERALLPSNPFTQATRYALERETRLRTFLEYPGVPIDTNHLEREIRPIALGRKNWMFCWTEIGAKYVGMLQSLLATCRLHDVDPYTYLVDVLQRVDSHPAADVAKLTPRLWKEHYAANPLRSDVDRLVKNAAG